MDAAAIVQLVSLGISALSALAAAAAHYRINKNPTPSPLPAPAPGPVPAPTPNDPVHPNHPVLQGLLQAIAILQQALAQQGAPQPSITPKS
jgi:hypothetical protein